MSEQEPQDPHLYLEQYPNAVQDVDQAHVMAQAGDKYETEAANLRAEAVQKLGETAYTGGYNRTDTGAKIEETVGQITKVNNEANQVYNSVSDSYKKLMATKR